MKDEHQKLGFIGFGEVGVNVGRGLRSQGAVVYAYDKLAQDSSYGPTLHQRAKAADVQLVSDLSALASHADVVMCAVPGTNATEAAEAVLPYLRDNHLYVDMCSASPQIKRSIEERIGGTRMVDAAIMTPPLRLGHRITVSASGREANRFESLMTPYGMKVEVIGDEIGMAAGLKMLRTVFMKGMNALLTEALLGAYRLGIHEEVLDTISYTLETQGFRNMAHLIVTTDVLHAQRRADETRMALGLLEEVGIDGVVVKAVIERLQWSADLGLGDHFDRKVPDSYVAVLRAMDEKLGNTQSTTPS